MLDGQLRFQMIHPFRRDGKIVVVHLANKSALAQVVVEQDSGARRIFGVEPVAARRELAKQMGADAVIAMPPYVLVPDFETTYAYFKAISDAVSIPVWIQNAGVAPLSTDQIIRLCSEIENVSWVKEEVNPSPQAIERLVARNSPATMRV